MESSLLNLLLELPGLSALPAEVLEEISLRAELINARTGDYLFRQGGEQPEDVYCLVTATAEILVGPPEGESTVSLARPGQLLGFLSLYSTEPSPASVRIAKPGFVLSISGTELSALMDRYPPLSQFVATTMAERLQDVLQYSLVQAERSPLQSLETFPFRKRVSDVMSYAALVLAPTESVQEAAQRMRESGQGAVVVAIRGEPVGIVTERDMVLRAVAPGIDAAATPLEAIMSSPAWVIEPDAYLYSAMGLMRGHRILYLPVVDEGRLVGLLSFRHLLALGSHETLFLVDQLQRADSVSDLAELRERARNVCIALLEEGLPATQVSRILSSINRDIQRKALEVCLGDMCSEGWSEPPVPFCLIVMGSHGRAENHFCTDQDHGMILADVDAGTRSEVEPYFARLGERLTEALTEIGFPKCTGEVMSDNPLWRGTLAEWREQLKGWFELADPSGVRQTTVFYDFAPLWGEVSLAADLRTFVTEGVRDNAPLLRRLFEDAAHHKVPLTLFKGFVTEKSGARKGKLDLKASALRFMVECARILALLHGVTKLGTVDRIEELEKLGAIPADEGRFVRTAFESTVRFLLHSQARQIRSGMVPDTHIRPSGLPIEERYLLRLALEAAERLQTVVHASVHSPFVRGLAQIPAS
ncbi:MAG: CBS domain-containing protein [Deltaproteobacteria bacterium]|nr:CBS domain-containing protein [Deltaproteobacteria bacterium]